MKSVIKGDCYFYMARLWHYVQQHMIDWTMCDSNVGAHACGSLRWASRAGVSWICGCD